MIIDITQEILGCKVYPGDPAPQAEKLCDMEKGDLYNLTVFSMCAHNGTHLDAARVFAAAGIKLIGNESQSVGPVNAPMEVHKILLEKEIVLLEGIVLTDVAEGEYYLYCRPLNIKGIEGSPCRAILIKE